MRATWGIGLLVFFLGLGLFVVGCSEDESDNGTGPETAPWSGEFQLNFAVDQSGETFDAVFISDYIGSPDASDLVMVGVNDSPRELSGWQWTNTGQHDWSFRITQLEYTPIVDVYVGVLVNVDTLRETADTVYQATQVNLEADISDMSYTGGESLLPLVESGEDAVYNYLPVNAAPSLTWAFEDYEGTYSDDHTEFEVIFIGETLTGEKTENSRVNALEIEFPSWTYSGNNIPFYVEVVFRPVRVMKNQGDSRFPFTEGIMGSSLAEHRYYVVFTQ